MKQIEIRENNLSLVFGITEKQEVKLLHFSALPFDPASVASHKEAESFRLVEVQVSGLDRTGVRFGTKYTLTSPGMRLKYRDFKDTRNAYGRKLEIITADEPTGLAVHSNLQFYDGLSMVRSWSELVNEGQENLGIEYVSSFELNGIDKEGMLTSDEKLRLHLPHNGWQKELIWASYDTGQLGLSISQPEGVRLSSKVLGVGNTGSWSTKQFLPMGCLCSTEVNTALVWQIEHNGSWYWEIGDQDGHLYLQAGGPNEHHNHWWKQLKPGERFESVPVSVGSVIGGLQEALQEATKYRRAIRRKCADNEKLPVIFNDYMNCLYGDPTTEKELPMIDKAAEAGCEYYVIDCGWYADGDWWDGVGEWLPSKKRFPDGFANLLGYIRSKGMVPGVWLEIEVMGIHSPLAKRVPQDWYFQRHGQKVYDRSRYQLDFRNPEVCAHADTVIDRLVKEYGVGYIKMDYNIDAGIGTDWNADSCGDGLLEHNRAYLRWLDGIFERYPDLVIENCSSGGMRLDYAMLSRCSIQSTSDQEDYRYYATIAANAPSAVTPEQAAVWSYPLADADCEQVAFNMVSALLLRIHQSGHLVHLSGERFALVKEAIETYKTIRGDVKEALPFWPLGMSGYQDPWVSMGLTLPERDYVAVWRRESETSRCVIPLRHRVGHSLSVSCVYPKKLPCEWKWNANSGELTVLLPSRMSARLFSLREV